MILGNIFKNSKFVIVIQIIIIIQFIIICKKISDK